MRALEMPKKPRRLSVVLDGAGPDLAFDVVRQRQHPRCATRRLRRGVVRGAWRCDRRLRFRRHCGELWRSVRPPFDFDANVTLNVISLTTRLSFPQRGYERHRGETAA